jgi:outer membrane protein
MRRLPASLVMLAVSLTVSAAAQTAVPTAQSSGPTKIAVISFQVAVAQTNEFQRNFADLQKKYQPKKDELQALDNEIKNLKAQLQAQTGSLSAFERANRQRTIDDKEKLLTSSAQAAQAAFQKEMQEIYTNVASKVYDVMSAYAKQWGYTLILDISQQKSQEPAPAGASDITRAVMDAYNVKSGVPPPPRSATH